MSNLADKLAAWERAESTRDAELLAKIDALTSTATLETIYNEIVALRGTGGPETTLRSINQSIWNIAGTAPGASLIDLLTALQAMATETTSAAILAAIGTLASNPANYTLKDLLALVNTGMHATPPGKAVFRTSGTGGGGTGGGGTGGGGTGGGGTGTADGPTNPDPGTCDGLGTWSFAARTSSMDYLGNAPIGGVDHDIYAPRIMEYLPYFATYQNAYGTQYHPDNTARAPLSINDRQHEVAVCVSWDFTGMDTIPIVASLYGWCVSQIWYPGDTAPVGYFWTYNTYVGCDSVDFGLTGTASTMYPWGVSETRSWRVAVPVGIVPPANIFFHVAPTGSAFL